MAKLQIVTLLTDFGARDSYVGAMKGAILSVCPTAQIVDLCHEVPPHDVLAGGFLLAQAAPAFPPGTLHVAVVDPGVGTERPILAARFGGHAFLFPDNGIISFIAAAMPLEQIVALRDPAAFATRISRTFHGRDIFAPVAGYLLRGTDLSALGPQPPSFKLLDLPVPRETPAGLDGQVIFVDVFGNLVSNITRQHIQRRWPNPPRLDVTCGGRPVGRLMDAYANVPPLRPLALIDSADALEIAVNCGRACDVLGVAFAAQVEIREARGEP